ncbi:hypothetical protein ACFE04_001110 [Oxalis oulophora]
MEKTVKAELQSFLSILPPVDFCCLYGSTLHPNNHDKSKMIDFILGVENPELWHSQNLKKNVDHYSSCMKLLGGGRLITQVADKIGVGIHFNPFVEWNDKRYKYGVVRMDNLVRDILNWERLYISGRLQKPVHILVDNLDIENVNSVNLRAAMSGALLLLPSKFTEEDLYAKICSLSYEGDVRMLFAEDRNKVKKIVQGQFDLFQSRYKPFLEEYQTKDLLRSLSSENHKANMSQDCGLSATCSLVSFLPAMIRSDMGMKLGEKKSLSESGKVIKEVMIGSREEAAKSMQRVLKRRVKISSVRQAVSGVVAAGGVNAVKYLATKVQKAWKSWT